MKQLMEDGGSFGIDMDRMGLQESAMDKVARLQAELWAKQYGKSDEWKRKFGDLNSEKDWRI